MAILGATRQDAARLRPVRLIILISIPLVKSDLKTRPETLCQPLLPFRDAPCSPIPQSMTKPLLLAFPWLLSLRESVKYNFSTASLFLEVLSVPGYSGQRRMTAKGKTYALPRRRYKNCAKPYGKWLEGFGNPFSTQQSSDRTSDEGVI